MDGSESSVGVTYWGRLSRYCVRDEGLGSDKIGWLGKGEHKGMYGRCMSIKARVCVRK